MNNDHRLPAQQFCQVCLLYVAKAERQHRTRREFVR